MNMKTTTSKKTSWAEIGTRPISYLKNGQVAMYRSPDSTCTAFLLKLCCKFKNQMLHILTRPHNMLSKVAETTDTLFHFFFYCLAWLLLWANWMSNILSILFFIFYLVDGTRMNQKVCIIIVIVIVVVVICNISTHNTEIWKMNTMLMHETRNAEIELMR